jgi:hypothetical protein
MKGAVAMLVMTKLSAMNPKHLDHAGSSDARALAGNSPALQFFFGRLSYDWHLPGL